MSLPSFNTKIQELSLMQSRWATILDPIVDNSLLKRSLLTGIVLTTGVTNNINHKLQRKLQGWNIVRQRASASIYDTQDANTTPDLTLQLITSADVTVDIEVF